jgi:hypothetical protein
MSSASWNAATDIYGVNDLGAYQVVITTKADSQIYIGGQTATLTYRIKRADLSSILSNNIGAI